MTPTIHLYIRKATAEEGHGFYGYMQHGANEYDGNVYPTIEDAKASLFADSAALWPNETEFVVSVDA